MMCKHFEFQPLALLVLHSEEQVGQKPNFIILFCLHIYYTILVIRGTSSCS